MSEGYLLKAHCFMDTKGMMMTNFLAYLPPNQNQPLRQTAPGVCWSERGEY